MKIFIFLLALFWSASQVFADECKTKPDECTPKNLCEVATEIKNGKTIWSEAIKSNEHVVFAKELGINCGVSDSLALCQTDPNECKISDLCSFATVGSDHKIKWNEEHASEYVKLAKEYGLTCEVASEPTVNAQDRYEKSGVWIKAPKELNSSTNTEENSFKTLREDEEKNEKIDALNKEVARLALLLNEAKDTEQKSINEIKNLSSRLNAALAHAARQDRRVRKLEEEAKTKIDLDVSKESCEEKPKHCSDHDLCKIAKRSEKSWNSYKPQHVWEAKQRNLSCGIPETKSTTRTLCLDDPKVCTVQRLCKLATSKNEQNLISWRKFSFAKHAKEARERGLDCGVVQVAKIKPVNEFLFDRKDFLLLSLLQKKQLQYALKELGYYTSSVDGLYGPNTERAVRDYAKNKGIKRNYPNSVLRQLTAEVSVPSSFATAKKTTSNAVKQGSTKSHYNGLKPLVSNPSLSAKQAWIKCATRANTAHRNAYKSYSTPKYGSTTNCTLNATRTGIIINGNLDCESSPQHGGFVGGITNTLGRASVAKAAAESTMSSCLTKHGWKR